MSFRLSVLGAVSLPAAIALLERACEHDRAAEVAAEKLFGDAPDAPPAVAIGAWSFGRLVGLAAVSGRHLRLLVVAPEFRRMGIGAALLVDAAKHARAVGATSLRTGAQPGNYLAPGVDERDVNTIAWLERRGLVRVATHENLKVELAGDMRFFPALPELPAGYRVDRGASPALLARIATDFSSAWAFEAARGCVHVALTDDGAPAAFALHDGNNRGLGWFGPAGTFAEHRGRGLGAALLIECLRDLVVHGHAVAEIAWIGPRAFYEKAVGAVTGRRFVVLEQSL